MAIGADDAMAKAQPDGQGIGAALAAPAAAAGPPDGEDRGANHTVS